MANSIVIWLCITVYSNCHVLILFWKKIYFPSASHSWSARRRRLIKTGEDYPSAFLCVEHTNKYYENYWTKMKLHESSVSQPRKGVLLRTILLFDTPKVTHHCSCVLGLLFLLNLTISFFLPSTRIEEINSSQRSFTISRIANEPFPVNALTLPQWIYP